MRPAKFFLAAILGVCCAALAGAADLPPFKIPAAASYYPQHQGLSGRHLLQGDRFVMPVRNQNNSSVYDWATLDGNLALHAETPVVLPSSNVTLYPFPGGGLVQFEKLSVGGRSKLNISTRAIGSSFASNARQIDSDLGSASVCEDYALVADWAGAKSVTIVPFDPGLQPVKLDMSAEAPTFYQVSNVVAGGSWLAVGIAGTGGSTTVRWLVYDASDYSKIGEFTTQSRLSDGAFAFQGRFLVIGGQDQVEIRDVDALDQVQVFATAHFGGGVFNGISRDDTGFWVLTDLSYSYPAPAQIRHCRIDASGAPVLDFRCLLPIGSTSSVTMAADGHRAVVFTPSTGRIVVFDRYLGAPLLKIASQGSVDESAGAASVVLSLDEPAKVASSIRFRTRAGTAQAGVDFTPVDQRVGFALGQQTAVVTVPILEDLVPENHESILLDLLEPEGIAVVPDVQRALVIRASGFELDQSRVFNGMPAGWTLTTVVGVTTNYVVAILDGPSTLSNGSREQRMAAFNLKAGGFLNFADFIVYPTSYEGQDWSEKDGVLSYVAFSTAVRWDPRSGSASGPLGGSGVPPLAGMEVDGKAPYSYMVAEEGDRIAVAALYNPGYIGWGVTNRVFAHVYDRNTRTKLWSRDLGTTESYQIRVGLGDRHVLVNGDQLTCLDLSTGDVRWSNKLEGRISVGPKHAFILGTSNGAVTVVELDTGVSLGALQPSDLFGLQGDRCTVLASPSGAFVGTGTSLNDQAGLRLSGWAELKDTRTRPAVLMDPPVLMVSNGGSPVSFRVAEPFAGSVDIAIMNDIYMGSLGMRNPRTGSTVLTVPGDGTVVTAMLDVPPSRMDYTSPFFNGMIAGSIRSGGTDVFSEFRSVSLSQAMPDLEALKAHLAPGFDFTKANRMVFAAGKIFVGFPDYYSSGIWGKVEVFDAASGARIRTLTAPVAAKATSFGQELLVEGDRLLVAAPGLPESPRPRFPKSGSVYVFNTGTGQLLASIPNPTSGAFFGGVLASSPEYFAVAAVSPTGPGVTSPSTVTVFRWSDFKKVLSKTGSRPELYGSGLAIANGELLVGAPGATVRQGRTAKAKEGRILSYQLPKGRAGTDWVSPWGTAGEGGFGRGLIAAPEGVVVKAGGEALDQQTLQVFGSVRGSARYLIQADYESAIPAEFIRGGFLVGRTSRDAVLTSLEDGEVVAEARLVPFRPNTPAYMTPVTAWAVTPSLDLYWIESGALYASSARNLGGFRWWSRIALPAGSPLAPAADADGNGTADLYDYVTERVGATPIAMAPAATGGGVTLTATGRVPDVITTVEVKRPDGEWIPVCRRSGDVWWSAVGTAVPVNGSQYTLVPDDSWAKPIEYRLSHRLNGLAN